MLIIGAREPGREGAVLISCPVTANMSFDSRHVVFVSSCEIMELVLPHQMIAPKRDRHAPVVPCELPDRIQVLYLDYRPCPPSGTRCVCPREITLVP
jgi:hypothetical protein